MTVQIQASKSLARFLLVMLVQISLIASAFAVSASAQTGFDCFFKRTVTAAGQSMVFDNRTAGCVSWSFTYFTSGVTASVWTVEGAEDNRGTPGTSWSFNPVRMPDIGIVEGVNPTRGSRTYVGYMPWIRINVTTFGGTSPIMTIQAAGKRARAESPFRIQGQVQNAQIPGIDNAAVVVAGIDDNGVVRPLRTEQGTGNIATSVGGQPRRCTAFQPIGLVSAGTTAPLFTFNNQTLSVCSMVITSDVAGTVRVFLADIGTCAAPSGIIDTWLPTQFIAANGNITYSGGGVSPIFEIFSTKQACITAGAANAVRGQIAYVIQ